MTRQGLALEENLSRHPGCEAVAMTRVLHGEKTGTILPGCSAVVFDSARQKGVAYPPQGQRSDNPIRATN